MQNIDKSFFKEELKRLKVLTNLFSWLGTGIAFRILPKGLERETEKNRMERSNVVSVFHPDATDGTKGKDNANLNDEVVKQMIDEGIKKFTGTNNIRDAWALIIPDPSKKIAIKVNCQIQGIYTKAKVVKAITESLIARGVQPDNIIIYDRTDNAFPYAGFKRNLTDGIKVGTVADFGGYSRLFFDRLANLLIGGYSSSLLNFLFQLSSYSNLWMLERIFSAILPQSKNRFNCEYLINVPVLKALDVCSGVTLSMKNHYGSIAGPSLHHEDVMDYLPYLNNLPPIKYKTKLIVLDAIFCEYKWVNSRSQEYVSTINKILFSNDPVAIDYLGWKIIEKERKKMGLQALSIEPKYIRNAAMQGIGDDNPTKFEHDELNLTA